MQIVNAKLRGTTPIGLTLDPQNNGPLIPRLRCHVALAEYEGIEESKKTHISHFYHFSITFIMIFHFTYTDER